MQIRATFSPTSPISAWARSLRSAGASVAARASFANDEAFRSPGSGRLPLR